MPQIERHANEFQASRHPSTVRGLSVATRAALVAVALVATNALAGEAGAVSQSAASWRGRIGSSHLFGKAGDTSAASLPHATTIQVNPGESIQTKCVNAASSGDTCVVNSGTYPGRVTVSKSITLACSGTCVVIDGFNVTASSVTIRGFEIRGAEGIKIQGQDSIIENAYIHDIQSYAGGISFTNSSVNHITIRNNKIRQTYNQCIRVTGSYNLIENNDCGFVKQQPNYDADCFDAFGHHQTFRGNYCHDIWYGQDVTNAHVDCIQTWQWSSLGGSMRDSLFEGNICDVPDIIPGVANAKGFQMSSYEGGGSPTPPPSGSAYPCRNNTFRYNVVHSNHLGIFMYCQDMTTTNNTFISDDWGAHLNIYYSRGTNVVQNNIFVDQSVYPIGYNTTASRDSIVGGNNCFFRHDGSAISGYKKFPGDLWGVDPKFVDFYGGDYHLRSDSPCANSGAYPLGGGGAPTNTPTPPRPTATPTRVFSATPTRVPSATPTRLPSATPANTPTPSPLASFVDVPPSHPYFAEIEALYRAGYTAGCGTDPLRFCPDAAMNRAESAVFVERGIHSASYAPPVPSSQVFADVPLDSWAAPWIDAIWLDQFTQGCGTNPLIYCPWQGHTRAEGCVFYLRMLNGAGYAPPPPTQQLFADVPLDAWYAAWIHEAYGAGILPACQTLPDVRLCPEGPLSRGLAAYMMVQAKGLPQTP